MLTILEKNMHQRSKSKDRYTFFGSSRSGTTFHDIITNHHLLQS